jgi:hypothetical protein
MLRSWRRRRWGLHRTQPDAASEIERASKALLFVNKKKQKNFGNWASAVSNFRLQIKKSFLCRFFSKSGFYSGLI